ncbi:hypothetical protein GZH47_28380 [Paenibacillus rhizovicinus]|uniref:Uncharacterized protein n=1 Tax=Paenibacillus rhizovicinus TaxID=2704463 RepID=A0A6C0P726_9BACL|nr:hypothetical protein [Paenibacillus rhizovicinus]QHW34324.1 hypothetical protein GZH47_28380 [Paenibacillus rhizovicinus]
MQISITRGLAELKTLDARIKKAIQDTSYIGLTTGKKPIVGYKDNQAFELKVKANNQSAGDLIKRRNLIKTAIVASNAATVVTIGRQAMTVAEAIERKSSIAYEQLQLQKMTSDYAKVLRKFEEEDEKVKARLDELIKTTFGTDKRPSPDQYESTSQPFLEQNAPKLIDPLNLKDQIDRLQDRIDEFLTNVDFILSESNSITRIEIPDSV